MNRRNFLLKYLLWIIALFLGLIYSREGAKAILERINSNNNVGSESEDKIGDLSSFKANGDTVIQKMKNEFEIRGINPEWFGARGDGVTDDSDAIQAAIDYASRVKRGINTILFDGVIYIVNKTIVVPRGVSLIGKGTATGSDPVRKSGTIFKSTTMKKGFIIQLGDPTLANDGEGSQTIKGIKFEGSNSAKDLVSGIICSYKMTTITECSFIDLRKGVELRASECWVMKNYDASCYIGYYITSTESHILFNHGGSSYANALVKGAGNIIIGNKWYGDGAKGQFGIVLEGGFNIITGNYIDAFEQVGIYIHGVTGTFKKADYNTITGNRVYSIGGTKGLGFAIFIHANSNDLSGNIISSNAINNQRQNHEKAPRIMKQGIRLEAARERKISNHSIANNTIGDVTQNAIVKTGEGKFENISITGNPQYITKNVGTISAKNGQLVNHGLSGTPKSVIISSQDNITIVGADAFNEKTFRVNIRDIDGTLVNELRKVSYIAEM